MSMAAELEFRSTLAQCLREGRLFEDPEFPAVNRSIFFTKEVSPHVKWKRPTEICESPKFIVDGLNRFDLDQGALGNCWFVAAAATLATKRPLLEKVVPTDQSFSHDYAGVFHFNFWQYGRWKEVIVDDRLPVKYGKFLLFCKNREEPNEFWAALLEKAYAKLHGSYEALRGGKIQDALVDFTGGAGEVINLQAKKDLPKNLFRVMFQMRQMNTLLGCSIASLGGSVEQKLSNGLWTGHAYSVTGLVKFNVGGEKVRLIRLRNPWGKKEWNGPWSDSSAEWGSVSEDIIQELSLRVEEDGEFWMGFDDWKDCFTELQICHLTPQSPIMDSYKKCWRMEYRHGAWVKGVCAGGWGQEPHQELYWSNPQYHVTLSEADDEDDDGMCTVVISLLQKHRRKLRNVLQRFDTNIIIGFDVFKMKEHAGQLLDGSNYDSCAILLERQINLHTHYREVCHRYRLHPGEYAIIPATYIAQQEADYFIRVVTEKQAHFSEIDEETGPIKVVSPQGGDLVELFHRFAGDDEVIDARELREVLNILFKTDAPTDGAGPVEFSVEDCRTLVTSWDKSHNGSIEFRELSSIVDTLMEWQKVFQQHDPDGSGTISIRQLRKAFKDIGMNLSRSVWQGLAKRFGGKRENLEFQDFVVCATKVKIIYDTFAEKENEGTVEKEVALSLDQWMELALRH